MTTTVVGVSPATNLAGIADEELVTRLRNGDEAAFREMVSGWSPAMLNLARQYVSTRASGRSTFARERGTRQPSPPACGGPSAA